MPCSVPTEKSITSRQESLIRYYIIYNGDIMFHPADRVMRQLGLKQIIPDEPSPSSHTRANTSVRLRDAIHGWTSRFETHSVEHMSEMLTCIDDSKSIRLLNLVNKLYFQILK